MKKPKSIATLILVAGITAATSVATLADPMMGQRSKQQCNTEHRRSDAMGPGMMGGDRLPPFLHGLQLTDAQRDKIFDITYAQIPTMRNQGKQLRDLHRQAMELTLSPDYDAGKLKKLVDAEVKLQVQQQLARAETDHQIYLLLTDDQRQQLAKRKRPQ